MPSNKVIVWEEGNYDGTVEKDHDKNYEEVPHGKGTWKSKDENLIRKGTWELGVFDGDKCQIIDKVAGETYHGPVRQGKKHGYGCIFFDAGGEHFAMFEESKANGPGLRVFDDKSWYLGEWKEGEMQDGPVPLQPPPPGNMNTMSMNPNEKSAVGKIKPLPDRITTNTKMVSSTCPGTYSGQVDINGAPHGRGILVSPNGDTYSGQFSHGKRHGYGHVTHSDGGDFNGEWANNVRSGQGSERKGNGDRYEGQFKGDAYDGTGEHRRANGDRYFGEYKAGKMHGLGRLTKANGDEYRGTFRDGKKNGQGELEPKSRNSAKYAGEWLADEYHGKGLLKEPSGNSYEGKFKAGLRHGIGEYVWKNGGNYVGSWQLGLMHGKGTLTAADGTTYNGSFVAGRRSGGKGVLNLTNGDRYEGAFLDGLPDGKGKYCWANGSQFVGEYTAGLRTGSGGVMSWAEGDTYEGSFKRNRMEGEGTLVFSSGDVHQGRFEKNRPHGLGVHVFPDGSWFEGRWHEGKLATEIDLKVIESPFKSEANIRLLEQLGEDEEKDVVALKQAAALWTCKLPNTEERADAKQKKFTAYDVVMTCRVTGESFKTSHRFSSLLEFSKTLSKTFAQETADCHFPPKNFKMFGNTSPEFIEKRRGKIEKYMQGLCLQQVITSHDDFRQTFSIPKDHETTETYKSKVGEFQTIYGEKEKEIKQARESDNALRIETNVAEFKKAQETLLSTLDAEDIRIDAEIKWIEAEAAAVERIIDAMTTLELDDEDDADDEQVVDAGNDKGDEESTARSGAAVDKEGNPFGDDQGSGTAVDKEGNPFGEDQDDGIDSPSSPQQGEQQGENEGGGDDKDGNPFADEGGGDDKDGNPFADDDGNPFDDGKTSATADAAAAAVTAATTGPSKVAPSEVADTSGSDTVFAAGASAEVTEAPDETNEKYDSLFGTADGDDDAPGNPFE